jgi:hypothetical protein
MINCRRMREMGHVTVYGERRNVYRVSLGKLGQSPVGKPRHTRKDNIKTNLK